MKVYGIIGAGGFGREVIPLARNMVESSHFSEEPKEIVFVIEDKYEYNTKFLNGYRVLKLSEFLGMAGEKFFSIAIGDSVARERIFGSIPMNEARPFSIFSPTFILLDNNYIDVGAIFSHFTHITSNAKIGKHFHCNIYSYIAHDVVIGDYVTFGPGVKCNGNVIIEDHVYIGAGAIIKDGTNKSIIIGKGSVIGMGAVVTKSVAPGSVVVGNPAKPITVD